MNQYYNRFDPTKHYDRTLFLAGRGLQSAELNELQDYALSKIKGIGDAIFRDGDVIKGAACVVNPTTGAVTLEAGQIYVRGSVRTVEAAQFTIPLTTTVHLGVWYQETTITELEDPTLRDPAVGCRNYQEPGAVRLQANLTWGTQVEGVADTHAEGDFYPVYHVRNGVLIQHAPPPQLDAVTTALARYDREANGSYVVNGLGVTYVGVDKGQQTLDQQVFVIHEGKAHVEGYEMSLPHSLRVRFDSDSDVQVISGEPVIFQPNAQGLMTIALNNTPVQTVNRVDATVQKTVTVTHGAYTGVLDPLPDPAVLELILIQQGSTIYAPSTDYRLRQGGVDWSPSGTEPAPGSSYTVTYRYRTRLTPQNITEAGFTLSGAYDGSLISVDYTWLLPV